MTERKNKGGIKRGREKKESEGEERGRGKKEAKDEEEEGKGSMRRGEGIKENRIRKKREIRKRKRRNDKNRQFIFFSIHFHEEIFNIFYEILYLSQTNSAHSKIHILTGTNGNNTTKEAKNNDRLIEGRRKCIHM